MQNENKYPAVGYAIALLFLMIQANSFAQTPRSFASHHSATINRHKVDYTVYAEDTYLTNLNDELIGSIFSFSYLADDQEKDRPVLFVFNGGPGSSSLWLHVGVLGPKKVLLDQDVNPSVIPPYQLVDNPLSVLDIADVVFVDPIGTGYSQILGVGRAEDFYGIEEDVNSLAQFIERWLVKHGRWNSPKYLLGESYGSSRIALLPKVLMGGPITSGVFRGISVNGLIMLGTTLGNLTAKNNLEKEVQVFPAMASTAYYHGKVKTDMDLVSFAKEATQFANTDYLKACKQQKEGILSDEEKSKVIQQCAYYTGLSVDVFEDSLLVPNSIFARELLKDDQLKLGLYDSRYTIKDLGAQPGDPVGDDPAMSQYTPAFVGAFHQLLPQLNVDIESPYKVIVWKGLLQKWNWKRTYLPEDHTFADDLLTCMQRNKHLKVLVASGYYDLVTTAGGALYDLQASGVDMDRVVFKTYESGHMLYIGKTAEEFVDDVRALIQSEN